MGALKLVPAYKDYLWGGDRLARFYGKNGAPIPLAETWEVSLHPDGVTRLEDGRALSDFLTPLHLGKNAERFADFPLLVKLIDAAKDLSVQVHPSDAYALKNENSYGKTEMWYIVEAVEGAGIYLGFVRDVTEKEARDAIQNETFTDLLRFVPVKAGECYFIPAGTVHAIGAGCLICEIQQNSNLTYRIYDYGRRDASGALRPLHAEKAFSVMSLSPYTPVGEFLSNPLCEPLGISPYFHTEKLTVTEKTTLTADAASFRALVCVSGEGKIDGKPIMRGDTYFLPAGEGTILMGELTVISVSVRRYTVSKTDNEYTLRDDMGRMLAQSSASSLGAFLARYGLAEEDVTLE